MTEPASLILWPAIALLLFLTFSHVPVTGEPRLPQTKRYMLLAVCGHFLLIPLLVAVLLVFLPPDPGLRIGVCLVLLAPCTDWFISFTRLAGGSVQVAVLSTPMLLLGQLVLIPPWILLLVGLDGIAVFAPDQVLVVFGAVVLMPLAIAVLVQRTHLPARLGMTVSRVNGWTNGLLLAVLLLVGIAQLSRLADTPWTWLAGTGGIYIAFAVGATGCALALQRLGRLRGAPGRTLLVSMNARNSLVILPVALSANTATTASAAVILQMMVEILVLITLTRVAVRLMPDGDTSVSPPSSSRTETRS